MEVRTFYSDDDIIATELFVGPGADERVAETADRWRLTMLAKGFEDVDDHEPES